MKKRLICGRPSRYLPEVSHGHVHIYHLDVLVAVNLVAQPSNDKIIIVLNLFFSSFLTSWIPTCNSWFREQITLQCVLNSVCLAKRPSSPWPLSKPQRRSCLGNKSTRKWSGCHHFFISCILECGSFISGWYNVMTMNYYMSTIYWKKCQLMVMVGWPPPSQPLLLSQLIADDFAVNWNFMWNIHFTSVVTR